MALNHHHPFSQAFCGKGCRRGATVTASLPTAFLPGHAGFLCPCKPANSSSSCSSPLLPANECMQPAAGPSSSGRQRMGVVCMAHPRRVARVSSQIQREISQLFVTDQVLAGAICPERALGAREISALASVTDVYVSNDLQVVKVYVSIYSDPRGKKRAMDRLKRLEGYTRTQIGQRVTLRLTPEIRFEYDDSQDQAELIEKVIGSRDVERLKRELELEQQGASSEGVQGDGSEGFFDEYERNAKDEKEEDENVEEELDSRPRDRRRFVVGSTEAQMMQPGPFDDLFTGPEDDDVLVGWSSEQDRTAKNRAKRQRRKEQQQAQKQGVQN
ncbi:ribosome-binding factor A-domain-containing protein [Dunaliella salina]|uniref:Ribosome-binding factor A-domain-containing protein n=1 Tax=Dunaliella salina TaxID=3046 RepID=A0ABQ7GZJ1_DUNSA|nr:ribosome-binding factor A-domain-containing protein [Dunaliella salina]|eukprot:KAF5840038.1 ribosome-binding factor A-domain-containing protein [Dunaliella salina]